MQIFQTAYGAARKSGILESALGREVFRWAYFRYKRHLEDSCHHLVARFGARIRQGHVLDVGANIGYTAQLFARSLAPGYKVYAFEPEAWNYRLLAQVSARANRTGAGQGAIVPVRKVVGQTRGNARLVLNPRHHGDHRVALPHELDGRAPVSDAVDMVSLDEFVGAAPRAIAPISLIKIDVQGFEVAVCRGMSQVLTDNPAALVLLELSPASLAHFGHARGELLRFFAERGLRVGTLSRAGGFEERNYCTLPALAGPGDYGDLVFSSAF